MNTQTIILIVISIIAFLVLASALSKLPTVRHIFNVPEGYAGLLYQHGKFIEVLAPGRHVRWGRNFALDAQDSRKAFLAVAGQEVLTSDNIAVKLSLVVTYQVADPGEGRARNSELAGRPLQLGAACAPSRCERCGGGSIARPAT
jgi:regulator of protease activity HflC (stomatin/prohibitin superfamily)